MHRKSSIGVSLQSGRIAASTTDQVHPKADFLIATTWEGRASTCRRLWDSHWLLSDLFLTTTQKHTHTKKNKFKVKRQFKNLKTDQAIIKIIQY